MDERIRMLTMAFMCVFLFLIVVALYRFVEIGQVGNDIKAQYAVILQNYSCVPKIVANPYKDNSCVLYGYYYPECPKNNDSVNLSWR